MNVRLGMKLQAFGSQKCTGSASSAKYVTTDARTIGGKRRANRRTANSRHDAQRTSVMLITKPETRKKRLTPR